MSHRVREGREVEFFCEPLDAEGNAAAVDAVELLIIPETGSPITYTDDDPEITVEGTTYVYRTAELDVGKYVFQWGALKNGVMIDNEEGELIIYPRIRA